MRCYDEAGSSIELGLAQDMWSGQLLQMIVSLGVIFGFEDLPLEYFDDIRSKC